MCVPSSTQPIIIIIMSEISSEEKEITASDRATYDMSHQEYLKERGREREGEGGRERGRV